MQGSRGREGDAGLSFGAYTNQRQVGLFQTAYSYPKDFDMALIGEYHSPMLHSVLVIENQSLCKPLLQRAVCLRSVGMGVTVDKLREEIKRR